MKYARGITLVELMIGMIVSLFLMSGVLYVYQKQSENAVFQMTNTRFTQQMRDLMERMTNDIRRAGYLGYQYHVNAATAAIDNPFTSNALGGIATNITIARQTTPSSEATGSCITYAYNLDDDYPALVGSATTTMGSDFDADNMELFGFKLSGSALWMRTGMAAATTFDCDTGEWAQISDSAVATVTGLGFALANTACTNVTDAARGDCDATATPGDSSDDPVTGDLLIEVREVSITLTGQSVRDPAQTVTLTQTVDLPNDRVYVQP